MADFESDLRRHYGSQQLSDARAHAILAAGRAAVLRAGRRRWLGGMAAAILLGLGGAVTWWGGAQRINVQDAAAAVVVHFAQPDYTMAEISADRATLERWLREHGGPAHIDVPAGLRELPSFGCQVLEARGQSVFLICFFLDSLPVAPGTMPPKKDMVVTALDGTVMKKVRPLVHLVVVPRAAFRDVPAPGTRVIPIADSFYASQES